MMIQLSISFAVVLLAQGQASTPAAHAKVVDALEEAWQTQNDSFHQALPKRNVCDGAYEEDIAKLQALKIEALRERRKLNEDWHAILGSRVARYSELLAAVPATVATLKTNLEQLKTEARNQQDRRNALRRSDTEAIRAADALIEATRQEMQTVTDQIDFYQRSMVEAGQLAGSQQVELDKLKLKARKSSETAESMWNHYYRKLLVGGKLICEQHRYSNKR